MGDGMKCPRCGVEFNDGNICPNCHTQVINTNQVNQEVSVANSETFNNSVIESSMPEANNPVVQENALNINNQVSENTQFVSNQETLVNQVVNPTVATNVNNLQNETNVIMQDTGIDNTLGTTENQININSDQDVFKNDVENKPRDMSKIYYIILAIAVFIFLVLMGIILFNHFKKDDNIDVPNKTTTTTSVKEMIATKNKGIYTGLMTPTNIGNITYGGLYDKETDKVVNTDVEILRHLNEDEINSIIASANQPLNPGFRWDGVVYRVTLNDFDYLNGRLINPTMKTYLFDTYYKNNFFLVNENYYTIMPINGGYVEIGNGTSTDLMVAYQVPIDQNYYICFGENFSSLGCFINS